MACKCLLPQSPLKFSLLCAIHLQNLRRTAAEYASAVFIIAPKYPEDPMLADQYLSMAALSLGQYLQEAHTRMQERLSHAPNRWMHFLRHGAVRDLCMCCCWQCL